MSWYYKLHELPRIDLGGMMMSLLRWADLPCFYPVFAEANSDLDAEKDMSLRIQDLVVYDAPLRGPFPDKNTAVLEAKREFNLAMAERKQAVA